MPSSRNVQNARIADQIRDLHRSMLDIVGVMNSPQRDETMVREAGIPLDRALFPLLVRVERYGPIGVVDLADRTGRDHSTVSRQVGKLEQLGLVARQRGGADRRVREVAITPAGKAMTDRVEAARDQLGRVVFAAWPPEDVAELVRLVRKLADALLEPPA